MSTSTTISGVSSQEKLDSVMKVLETGIKQVFTSGRYQDYLTAMSKFHHYSFNNVMLILMQRPDATHVAGFHTWNHEFERSVNKGENGIRILAPMFIKKEIWSDKKDSFGHLLPDPITGKPVKELKEIQIQSFRIVSVFDVSQTVGKPLPELAVELKSHLDNAKDLEKAIRSVATCPIEFDVMPDSVNGYYDTSVHRIVIRMGMATSQTIKTILHEIAHSRLHDKNHEADNKLKDRATMEVEAESVAFVVCHHVGIDTAEYSFGYLAAWSENQELKELSSSLSLIQKESDELIRLITEQLE